MLKRRLRGSLFMYTLVTATSWSNEFPMWIVMQVVFTATFSMRKLKSWLDEEDSVRSPIIPETKLYRKMPATKIMMTINKTEKTADTALWQLAKLVCVLYPTRS